MHKARKLWPLALVLWACLGTTIWAQIQVSSGGVGSPGAGGGVTGYFGNGTVTAPSIAWASDVDGTGTGLYRSAANVIDFAINGTATWQINASGGLQPVSATNTYNIGTGNRFVKDLYLGASLQGGLTKTLTESSATGYVSVSVANSTAIAGIIAYTIRASDATDAQGLSGVAYFSCVATSAGVVTCAAVSDQHTLNPVSTGTLSNMTTQATAANLVTFSANAVSSLTQTTLRIDYRVELQGNTATVTGL